MQSEFSLKCWKFYHPSSCVILSLLAFSCSDIIVFSFFLSCSHFFKFGYNILQDLKRSAFLFVKILMKFLKLSSLILQRAFKLFERALAEVLSFLLKFSPQSLDCTLDFGQHRKLFKKCSADTIPLRSTERLKSKLRSKFCFFLLDLVCLRSDFRILTLALVEDIANCLKFCEERFSELLVNKRILIISQKQESWSHSN